MPTKKSDSKTLYIQIPADVHRYLKVRAAGDDMTLGAVVAAALRVYLCVPGPPEPLFPEDDEPGEPEPPYDDLPIEADGEG